MSDRCDRDCMTRCLLISVLALGSRLFAADWYAAPNASDTGDGSAVNPWPLQVALTQTTRVRAGDTLFLRGGTYHGPFVSGLSGQESGYITVRSAAGEWAVVKDPLPGMLATGLSNGQGRVDNVAVLGSQYWPEGTDAIAGAETFHLFNKKGTNWSVIRGWNGTTVTAHDRSEELMPCMDLIRQNGSFVIFRDFEVTSDLSNNRNTGRTHYLGSGLNMVGGVGNKAVNLVIHNVGHPGIGFWNQGAGGEVNGCLIWGNGDYYDDGSWAATRGSAIYSQNAGGMATIKNIISFRNFTTGGKVFGETGPVRDFQFISNIVFQCSPTLEGASGSTATSNLWFNGNVLLGPPRLSYVSKFNSFQYFINNTVVNAGFTSTEHRDSIYTNNVILLPKNPTGTSGEDIMYLSSDFASNDLRIVWDYNAYYLGNREFPNSWGFRTLDGAAVNARGGGRLKFSNDSGKAWRDWSGFDVHSTYQENWPTNDLKVFIQPSDYDPHRWHIAVVNTSTQTNATIALSGLGFAYGERYHLVDAQNWPVVVASETYTKGTIGLPLTLTSVSPIRGVIRHFTNEHTNVKHRALFNAFVLTRSADESPLIPPSDLRISQ